MTEEWYLLFPSVHDGMKMEKLLKGSSIKYALVPTPRVLSESCGIAMKVEHDQLEMIKNIIDEHGVRNSGFHSLIK